MYSSMGSRAVFTFLASARALVLSLNMEADISKMSTRLCILAYQLVNVQSKIDKWLLSHLRLWSNISESGILRVSKRVSLFRFV